MAVNVSYLKSIYNILTAGDGEVLVLACPCPGDQDIYQFTDQVHDTYEASVYVAWLI